MVGDREVIVVCNCGTLEHVFRFCKFNDSPEVYLTVHLPDNRPWYKRVWLAVKFIFGYKSPYGECAEIVLMSDEISQVKSFFASI